MDNDNCADCWSPSERKMKGTLEKVKHILSYPLLKLFIKLKITANMLSYFSAILGIIATVYLWYDLRIASILLLISLLIDGMDGALARITKQNTMQGSITDCFADQITISATTIGFIAIGLLNPIIGGLYLITYPLVITFSITRNIMKKPAIYVFRPRIIVYALLWIFTLTQVNLFDYVTLPISIILLYQVIKDFYFLRSQLK